MEKTNIFKCKPPEVHFTMRDRVPYNKPLTNLACSNRTVEYWPSVVFVRTSLRSVRTATTSGQYSPVRPSRSVSKRLIFVWLSTVEYPRHTHTNLPENALQLFSWIFVKLRCNTSRKWFLFVDREKVSVPQPNSMGAWLHSVAPEKKRTQHLWSGNVAKEGFVRKGDDDWLGHSTVVNCESFLSQRFWGRIIYDPTFRWIFFPKNDAKQISKSLSL